LKKHLFLSPFATLAVAGMLTLGGCNESGKQQASNSGAQPESPQQAGQPAPTGAVSAPGSSAAPQASPPPGTALAPPPTLDIPKGARLRVRLDQAADDVVVMEPR
jgi:hypothetical protein